MHTKSNNRKHMPRFYTNILAKNAEFICQAARETGFDITMGKDTYDDRASHISVWTNEPLGRDHGPFWQAYRRLMDTAKTE